MQTITEQSSTICKRWRSAILSVQFFKKFERTYLILGGMLVTIFYVSPSADFANVQPSAQ